MSNQVSCIICSSNYDQKEQFCPSCGWEEILLLSEPQQDYFKIYEAKKIIAKKTWDRSLEIDGFIASYKNEVASLKAENSVLKARQVGRSGIEDVVTIRVIGSIKSEIQLATSRACISLPDINLIVFSEKGPGEIKVSMIEKNPSPNTPKNRFILSVPSHISDIIELNKKDLMYRIDFDSHEFTYEKNIITWFKID